MAIPTYDQFYGPILEVLSDGRTHNSKQTLEYCAEVFPLSEEEKSVMLSSNRQTVLENRVAWARTYLKKAGLISSPSRGKYRITGDGIRALQDTGGRIDNNYLLRYDGFREFIRASQPSGMEETREDRGNGVKAKESTPQEIMAAAYEKIMDQLADDIMANIMDQKPSFFNRVIKDLLEKMGYGVGLICQGEVTGENGDVGIDGIIWKDALGFSKIYMRAKRLPNEYLVSGQDIQQFIRILVEKGMNRGLFITTSRFGKSARDFVDLHMGTDIVLIDGGKLTSLMIEYGSGVSTVYSYDIKKIDADYFNDEDE